ncbi:MAG: hypothetical protein CL599_01060 [Alteromonas sp.]|nr:hypothetical protein [Alteromonas sp.]OUX92044.1 MAG: hypothetical protein CBB95_01100 [Alteromonas sp. TMED35]
MQNVFAQTLNLHDVYICEAVNEFYERIFEGQIQIISTYLWLNVRRDQLPVGDTLYSPKNTRDNDELQAFFPT